MSQVDLSCCDFSAWNQAEWENLDIMAFIMDNRVHFKNALEKAIRDTHFKYTRSFRLCNQVEDDEVLSIFLDQLTSPVQKFFHKQLINCDRDDRGGKLYGYILAMLETRIRSYVYTNYLASNISIDEFSSDSNSNLLDDTDILSELVTQEDLTLTAVRQLTGEPSVNDDLLQERHLMIEKVRPVLSAKHYQELRLRVINGFDFGMIAEISKDTRHSVARRARDTRKKMHAMIEDPDLKQEAESLLKLINR